MAAACKQSGTGGSSRNSEAREVCIFSQLVEKTFIFISILKCCKTALVYITVVGTVSPAIIYITVVGTVLPAIVYINGFRYCSGRYWSFVAEGVYDTFVSTPKMWVNSLP